jgi:hypothetical protein
MPNSYRLHTGNGSTTDFAINQIDGWISSGFLKVYVNDVLQTTGYSFININTVSPILRFTTAPANGAVIRIQRETPATVSTFQSNVVDFNDGSILTAQDLDNLAKGLLHRVQEGEDTGSGALGKNLPQTAWDAKNLRITNVSAGIDNKDAVNMEQFTTAVLYGAVTAPQAWNLGPATGGTTYALSPAPTSLMEEMFIVEVGGVIQNPSTYTLTESAIVFNIAPPAGVTISVRNFGIARTAEITSGGIPAGAVGTTELANGSVTTPKIADAAVTTIKIADDAVTYAKMQNVSATDRLLGRSSAGAGNIEEITCTAAGRALIDDASATAQRTTLGLGGLAVKDTVSNADVAANAAVLLSKLQTVAPYTFVANPTDLAAVPQAIDAPAARTMLGISGTPLTTSVIGDRTKVGALVVALMYTVTTGDVMDLEPGETLASQNLELRYGTPSQMGTTGISGNGKLYRIYAPSMPNSTLIVPGTWTVISVCANGTDNTIFYVFLMRTA